MALRLSEAYSYLAHTYKATRASHGVISLCPTKQVAQWMHVLARFTRKAGFEKQLASLERSNISART